MITNIHVFVGITTFAYYFMLKWYKKSIQEKSKKSHLIYVLFVPIILYISFYFVKSDTPVFNGKPVLDNLGVQSEVNVSDGLLESSPYPGTISSLTS